MILHLVLDEKVIPRMMDLFDNYYSGNIYLCVTRKKSFEDLKFLKKRDNLFLLYGRQLDCIPWKEIKKVCIHFLDIHKVFAFQYFTYFRGLKPDVTIFFAWGGDYYNLVERKGFKVYSDNNLYRKNPRKSLSERIFWRMYDFFDPIIKLPFLKYKVNYIVASKPEYELICSVTKFNHLRGRLDMTYYSIEDVLGNLVNAEVQGHDIIIGNSASSSNNHQYVYDFLKGLPFEGEKIYIPMSYGLYTGYLEEIVPLYSNIPNVCILKDFIDLKSYNKLLCGCSTFIYGHFRQEGWGNIIIALYLGGKVYFPKESQNFKNFTEFGFKIFELEDIQTTYKIPLSLEEKEYNRILALRLFSKEKNKKNIEYICNAEL